MDKQQLLDQGNYLTASNDIMRRVLPKLTADDSGAKDAILLYFYFLSYVDGRPDSKDCGWAYPSIDKIVADTKISRRRIKALCDLLESYGLLETKTIRKNGQSKKLYKPASMPDTVVFSD